MQHIVIDASSEIPYASYCHGKSTGIARFFFYKFPQRLNWISVGCFYSNIVSATERERERVGREIAQLTKGVDFNAYMLKMAAWRPQPQNVPGFHCMSYYSKRLVQE